MMKPLLMSLVILGLVGALAGGGVFAYFSDTETSVGNTFTASNTDLAVDVDWYDGGREQNPWPSTVPLFDPQTTADIKPTHKDETTISLHVYCANATLLLKFSNFVNAENGRIDPEIEAGDLSDDSGELSDFLYLEMWEDNGLDGLADTHDFGEGDNVRQPEVFQGGHWSGEHMIWQGYASELMPEPGQGNETLLVPKITLYHCHVFYLAIGWEFKNNNGSGTDVNVAQSDSFGCDISFIAKDN